MGLQIKVFQPSLFAFLPLQDMQTKNYEYISHFIFKTTTENPNLLIT